MKICVIGPVTTRTRMGGVATFVEGLADGFVAIGCETIILTNVADKQTTLKGTEIVNLGVASKIKYILKTIKYLKNQQYDIIVGSTWYDFGLCLSPKIKGKKIHYLHGFGVPCDGKFRAFGIMLNDKLHKKSCSLVSNSSFTKLVNEIFFSYKVDAVIPIGISPVFKEIACQLPQNRKKKYDVIFVGRIRYNKGVDKILKALNYIKITYQQELSCVVVGDGPQMEECQKIARELKVDAEFAGKLEQQQTADYYAQSKVFVSLDGKEPYGQTFIEALMCGCDIVCPTTGGQIEYLKEYPHHYTLADSFSIESIGDAIYRQWKKEYRAIDAQAVYEEHSYEKTAKNIVCFCNGK